MADATPASGEPSSPVEKQAPAQQAFAVVGIGASAGGLEAVRELLEALPADTGMAFVLVQHLDPRHESKLDTILSKATAMPVREAEHGMRVEPNSLYVIAPNTTMTIADGVLRLTARDHMPGKHLPVDSFFRSLAKDRQSGAIGVVLSGTGSDGTLGLEDIKAAGGITLAQDEASARYPGMPLSALRSGCVDVALPPAEIGRELARIGQHPYVTTPAIAEIAPPTEDASFRRILELLRASFGVDFGAYRDKTIRRRIMRRMVLNVKEDLAGYAQQLENDHSEREALYHDILINVTSFFREPETFEALKASVFPEILKTKQPGTAIRIWSPGVAAGQEAYSLAMALLEFLDDKGASPPIQIFATDLSDTTALQKARDGIYPENIAAEVTPERLRRFFTKEDGKYRIHKTIRDMCVFAEQNVTADPPFSRVDLISCRNLLIYLSPQLQKHVVATFHYALNPDGFLLLGASETVGGATELFTLIDREHRLYRKRETPMRTYPHFAVDGVRRGLSPQGRDREQGLVLADWLREADRVLLNQYSPPGALINGDFQVLQFRGETGAYLKPSPGEASLNLLKMAREGLFLELRSAVAESRMHKTEVRRRDVRVRSESESRKIDLRVVPVTLPGKGEKCFLVLFEDDRHPPAGAESKRTTGDSGSAPGTRLSRWLHRHVSSGTMPHADGEEAKARGLRQELASTRDYLQSVIEEQDAANEELKSANEEILSTNEELQSTNEELETAKEELQSLNEELTTVNEQLHTRNAELSRLHNDLGNLIASAALPMIAVGVDLRIRRVTPAAVKLFDVLPTDTGRHIGGLNLGLDLPDLETPITEAIDSVKVQEQLVRDRAGRHQLLRIHPYRTSENKIDGAVVVLLDVEDVTAQAERLRQKAALLDLSADAIIVRNHDDVISFWNGGAERTYGWSAKEALGKHSHALLLPEGSAAGADIDALLRSQDHWQGEISHLRRDGTRIVVDSRQAVHRSEGGEVLEILEINRDVTERKRMLDELAEADRRKDEFLATLGHELRNPLTPLRNGMQLLRMVGADTREASQVRESMERNIGRMVRLIDDLLDVARITHGHIELRKEPVDLTATVSEVASELRPVADSADDMLELRLPKEALVVDADPVRLAQIVENLLNNAAKYTDHGRIDITLAKTDGRAVLRVRDSGIGIEPENLARIWDPFVQADSSLERRRSGLGLGLTLVRTLVEMHGGTIKASSPGPGKGSEFEVTLPLSEGAPTIERPSAPRAALKGRRILIVDDNADAVTTFASLLKLMENDVRTAASGPEAIELARQYRPEIVLLDIGLPGMNGYDVAKALRRDLGNGGTLIVAVSGYGAEQDQRRSADAGFDAHFVKPMEISALQEFLASREGD